MDRGGRSCRGILRCPHLGRVRGAAAGPLRNFGVVEEGVLYRSGQLTPAGLDRVLSEHLCRTVVSLRPPRDAESNAAGWEEEVCRSHGPQPDKAVVGSA